MFSKLQFEEFFVFLKASIDNSKNFSHENVFIEAAEKKKIEETEKHFNLAFNYRQAKAEFSSRTFSPNDARSFNAANWK